MADKPLMCGNFIKKEKFQVKWLGQILSSLGLADSVLQTVITREGNIFGACLEIAVIVNDLRAEMLGGWKQHLCYGRGVAYQACYMGQEHGLK